MKFEIEITEELALVLKQAYGDGSYDGVDFTTSFSIGGMSVFIISCEGKSYHMDLTQIIIPVLEEHIKRKEDPGQ